MTEEERPDAASAELEDAMTHSSMLAAGRDTAEAAEPKVLPDLNPTAKPFVFNPGASTWAPSFTPTAAPATNQTNGVAEGASAAPKEEHLDLGSYDLEEEEEEATPDLPELRNRKHVNIVFIGHVDHGKSTLCGNIMYQTGGLDERTLEKYEREAKQKSRESWKFAYAMDTTDEERSKGKTVEVGRGAFSTEHKYFTILDAPGHKGFIPHMIGGAAQADVGVLVISSRKGEFETGFDKGGQTREHTMLAKTAGVRSLIIAVTKMDDSTVQWSQARFNEVRDALKPYLKQVGYSISQDITFLPVSGISGDNITKPVSSDVCPWYDGPCLINVLDSLKPPERLISLPLRMPVHDKYKEMGGVVIIGKIQSGVIEKNQTLLLMPQRLNVRIGAVFMDAFEVECGEPGDNVRLKLAGIEDTDVHVGDVLCDPDKPVSTANAFDAQIIILEHKSIISAGYAPVVHIHAVIADVVLEKLLAVVDKKTNKVVKKYPRFVKAGMTCRARFVMESPICVERYKDFQQLGRFMIRDEGRTIGVGVITQLYKRE